MQLNGTQDKHFIGIFFNNFYPSQVNIAVANDSLTDSILNFKTIGGNLDFYVFNGHQYQEVLSQYFEIIGKPVMLPLQAHGFYIRKSVYNDKDYING